MQQINAVLKTDVDNAIDTRRGDKEYGNDGISRTRYEEWGKFNARRAFLGKQVEREITINLPEDFVWNS